MNGKIDSLVFSPPLICGGVKSLYSACQWLRHFGCSMISPFGEPELASWFNHECQLYDNSYIPDVIIYPEVYQSPAFEGGYRVCFALGKYGLIKPTADLVICKSHEILNWVKEQHPDIPTALILPSIDRAVFEYDGRPKQEIIAYITRPHKHPETAQLLRDQYGGKVLEIANCSESQVAEALKDAKVFVWRGDDKEGSPRPPKEALVAGCNVVGLESDLNEAYHTDFGSRCATVDELILVAGEALKMQMPTEAQRSVVRDGKDEQKDWLELFARLNLPQRKLACV
jgi:hypothetical protein